jgi:regulatory protein
MGSSILRGVTRESRKKRTAAGEEGEAKVDRLPAFDRALKLLELRPHFAREVERKLARAGYGRDEIAAAIARLGELGYLDDATHAKNHAATLAERKGYGATRIRAELARRGATGEAIGSALASVDPDAELARAREAAEKWLRKNRSEAAALARHLSRKGFDRRAIFTVLKELGSAPEDTEGESFAEE